MFDTVAARRMMVDGQVRTADVTDPEQLALAVDRVRVVFGGPVDILICAAAITGPLNSFVQTALKPWSQHLQGTDLLCILTISIFLKSHRPETTLNEDK